MEDPFAIGIAFYRMRFTGGYHFPKIEVKVRHALAE
jgi:hypothetical protein